ncbi:MAG TPA: hypothetical protein VFA51_09630, partial [Candidatus Udaeobacter sp.]|nr:hypothetical protein [Candidatus Udaeobacter sp.]
YRTDVNGSVDKKWTIKTAVSAVVLVALGSFCLPSPQILYGATAEAQRDRQKFTDKAKANLYVLAKTSTKVSVRKNSAQPVVQLFSQVGDISSRNVKFAARSLCPLQNYSGITRGSLTLRERGPPV